MKNARMNVADVYRTDYSYSKRFAVQNDDFEASNFNVA